MKREAFDPEWHLNDPRTRKWIVQCGACQKIGYRTDASEKFFGKAHLVKYFEPLQLDEAGLCDICREIVS